MGLLAEVVVVAEVEPTTARRRRAATAAREETANIMVVGDKEKSEWSKGER